MVLDLTIVAIHKPVAINIPCCGILQRRYITPSQYISFSSISVTYSGGLDDHHNRYIFAALFLSYSCGLDHLNRPFDFLRLLQCIPLLFWPKCHFGFSFPSSFHFPMYPTLSLLLALRKNPLSLYKHFHHQSFTTSHH